MRVGPTASGPEAARVRALADAGLLGEGATPGPSFRPVVELATQLLRLPMGCVTLIDGDHVHVRGGVPGLQEGTRWPRATTLCDITLARGETVLVGSLAADPDLAERFADNALGVAAYAAAPLRLPGGDIVGTLCVAAPTPHAFEPGDRAILESLARVIEQLLVAQTHQAHLAQQAALVADGHAERERVTGYLEQAERIGRIGHWSLNADGSLFFSKNTYALHGLEPGVPMSVDRAIDFYLPDERKAVRRLIQHAIDTDGEFDFEGTLVTTDGTHRRIRSIGSGRREADGTRRVFGVVQDISDEAEQRQKLHWAASHDPLTSLLNRRAFHEEACLAAQRWAGGSAALVVAVFDLDHLKVINDVHGHAAGDQAIRRFAETMDATFPDAVRARLGGDEFGLLLRASDLNAALAEIEAFVARVEAPADGEHGPYSLACTVGAAALEPGDGLEEAEQRADLALYHGKEMRRGAVTLYSPDFELPAAERSAQAAMVRAALADGVLQTHFQPIVALDSGAIVGAEALVRLVRDGTPVPAERFVLGLADSRIAAAVLEMVIADSLDLLIARPDLPAISVNVAASDLLGPDFADRVLGELDRRGLSPTRLVLEITESTLLIGEQRQISTVLDRLRRAGIGIALDDFGTGFSSLSHLSDYPISRLKIDKRFVSRLRSHRKEQAVTLAVINLARQLGIDVVAEGVEDEPTRAQLAAAGCQLGQGYLWSAAVADLGALLPKPLAAPRAA